MPAAEIYYLADKQMDIAMHSETTTSANPIAVLVLAHGAGAGMNHSFLVAMANALAERGITTVRFNFPYMDDGKKFPGSPKPNIAAWGEILTDTAATYPGLPLFMAGKSYGGRMGSHLLAERPDSPVKGIIYLGFPLHPAGKVSRERAAHLPEVKVPQLFLQGTADALATIDLLREVVSELSNATLVEIEEGDHSFKTPKSRGISQKEMFAILSDTMVNWIKKI